MMDARPRLPVVAVWVVFTTVLLVLATANAGGYRYGVADQAMYIPSILDQVRPALFPRDGPLLRAQDGLMIGDELLAVPVGWGLPLPGVMLAGYIVSLVGIFVSALVMGRTYYANAWASAAFCAAITLRHQILDTSANTFEGYFHPRLAAFACGVGALASVARDRVGLAWLLVVLGGALHPTTGVWWGVWLLGATWVLRPSWRQRVALAITCMLPVAAWMLGAGPMSGRLSVMDPGWLRVLAVREYLFPDDWPAGTWVIHVLTAGIVLVTWHVRRQAGVAREWEAGAVAGIGLLVILFAASLPFIDARVVLAVQLQTSRVFWLVDLLATASVVWWLAEATRKAPTRATWRPVLVCLVVVLSSAGRGLFILEVERPERSLVERTLPDDAWTNVGQWAARHTPIDAHLLADPDHAWKFGRSLRVVAERDVLVEGVKDAAVAMYSREMAERLEQRLDAVGDFSTLEAARAQALARRYDLDYLVADRPFRLPEVYRNGTFRVYRLD